MFFRRLEAREVLSSLQAVDAALEGMDFGEFTAGDRQPEIKLVEIDWGAFRAEPSWTRLRERTIETGTRAIETWMGEQTVCSFRSIQARLLDHDARARGTDRELSVSDPTRDRSRLVVGHGSSSVAILREDGRYGRAAPCSVRSEFDAGARSESSTTRRSRLATDQD